MTYIEVPFHLQAQIYRHLVGGAPPVVGRVLSRVLQEDLARDFQDRDLGHSGPGGNVGWLWSPWFFRYFLWTPPNEPADLAYLLFPERTSSANNCEKDIVIQGWEPLTSDERFFRWVLKVSLIGLFVLCFDLFCRLIIIDRFLDPTEIMPTVEKQPDSTNCALVKVEEHEHSLAARVEGWRQAHQLLVLSRNSLLNLLEISSSWYSEPDVSASEVLCFAWELWRPLTAKNITGNSYTLLPLLWTLWDVDVLFAVSPGLPDGSQRLWHREGLQRLADHSHPFTLSRINSQLWGRRVQPLNWVWLLVILLNPAAISGAELSTAVRSSKAEGRRHCWRSLGVSSSNRAQAIIGSGIRTGDAVVVVVVCIRRAEFFDFPSKGIIWYCMLYKLYSVRPLLLFEAFVEPSIGPRWPGTKCKPKRSQMPFHA